MDTSDESKTDAAATTATEGTETAGAYGLAQLSETVSLWFVDPWPANKGLGEFQLAFFEDPTLADPILLQCRRGIPIPERTAFIPYDDMATAQLDETTVEIGRGALVFPDLATLIDDEYLRALPQTMQGTIVSQQEPTDEELLENLISIWIETQQATQ